MRGGALKRPVVRRRFSALVNHRRSSMSSALLSVRTWAVLFLLLLIWLPLLAIVRFFERDPAHRTTGRLFRWVGKLMTTVNPVWQVRIDGVAAQELNHPYVVVCNHQSMADIPIVCCLPWEMKWIAKAELFKIPVLGWLLYLAGDMHVDRRDKSSRARVVVSARQYLRDRCSVMFFPEGTRSRDGRLRGFSDGAFRLAIAAEVPVLPLVVDGTRGALPKHSWKFSPAEIRLRVLDPVNTTGLKTEDTAALRDRVHAVIARQLDDWRATHPSVALTGTAAVVGH